MAEHPGTTPTARAAGRVGRPRADRRSRGLAALLSAAVVGAAGQAEAYPWMISHDYTGCAQCHVDPSGAGLLTDYGRALGVQLLPTGGGEGSAETPGPEKDFLRGVIDLPPWLLMQADVRGLGFPMPTTDAGGEVTGWTGRLILMQSDLRGGIKAGDFVGAAALGVVSEGASAAWITSADSGWNLVAREYWAGWRPSKALLVRAGRMNLPFGVRTEEHTQYVRGVTRTSTNADQQGGVAVAVQRKGLRAEVLGIAGNPQVSPDAFRERGYAGFAGWAPQKNLEVGLSSMWTTAAADIGTRAPRARQAHGPFVRWSPLDGVAVLAEADLLRSADDGELSTGAASLAEVDWEVINGVHLRGIGQHCDTDLRDAEAGVATAWLAGQWFIVPRVDLRIDALHGTLQCAPGLAAQWYALGQVHFYL
jgi:hypothetical protein